LIGVFVFAIWVYKPSYTRNVGTVLTSLNKSTIKRLKDNLKRTISIENKYRYYSQIYDKLEDISVVNVNYNLRQESTIFLIKYYIENNDIQQATTLLKIWEEKYPYDLTAKLERMKLVKNKSLNESIDYTEYTDIPELHDAYIDYLLDTKQNKKVLAVLKQWNDIHTNDYMNQLKYVSVMQTIDKGEAKKYLLGLYIRYEKFPEVRNIIMLLLKDNNATKIQPIEKNVKQKDLNKYKNISNSNRY